MKNVITRVCWRLAFKWRSIVILKSWITNVLIMALKIEGRGVCCRWVFAWSSRLKILNWLFLLILCWLFHAWVKELSHGLYIHIYVLIWLYKYSYDYTTLHNLGQLYCLRLNSQKFDQELANSSKYWNPKPWIVSVMPLRSNLIIL
jgi:hypothetical protein